MVTESGEYRKQVIDLVGGGSSRVETSNRIEGSWCASYFGKIGVVKFSREFKYEEPINHSGHSQTWIRSAEKVQAMISQAETEKENPLANPRPFNIFGKQSIFAREVTVYCIRDPQLKSLYEKNNELVVAMFRIAQQAQAHFVSTSYYELACVSLQIQKEVFDEFSRSVLHNESANLGDLINFGATVMRASVSGFMKRALDHEFAQKKWLYNKIYEDMIFFTAAESSSAFFSGLNEEEINASYAIDSNIHPIIRKQLQIAYCADKIFSKILQGGMIEKAIMQDSCCTWALEKLAIAGVEIPNDKNGWFITDTRAYLESRHEDAV